MLGVQSSKRMQGRVCLVTGANAGLGRATAQGLAALGAEVLMICRNERRGNEAQAAIMAATRNERVRLLLADLSSMTEVRKLAAEVCETTPTLHVLINNAAIITRRRQVTAGGLETQFAVNHLAPFLLTYLLLDLLRASNPARIINVSSRSHAGAKIPFADLQSGRSYQPSKVYAWTKLANILFTYELAQRLGNRHVTVNALHPGVINTNLLYDYMGSRRRTHVHGGRYGATPERGADTLIYLATSDEVERVTGRYFHDRRPVASSPASHDRAAARRLWEVSAQLAGLSPM